MTIPTCVVERVSIDDLSQRVSSNAPAKESMDLSEGEILDEETLALFLDQLDYSDPKDMERFWKAHDAWQARFGETETTKVEPICGNGRAQVVVRGSGSFDDDPFLGQLCCAAIDKFNRLRQYKFARALEGMNYGCRYTLYYITFEATTEVGYTETFKAEVNCDTEDEVEVVNIECGDELNSPNVGSPTTKEKDLEISGRCHCRADEGKCSLYETPSEIAKCYHRPSA
ncbi:hypothetical protein LguiA_029845 [Lonicera macranthoides]